MQNWILYSDEQLLKQIIKTDANVLYAENKIIEKLSFENDYVEIDGVTGLDEGVCDNIEVYMIRNVDPQENQISEVTVITDMEVEVPDYKTSGITPMSSGGNKYKTQKCGRVTAYMKCWYINKGFNKSNGVKLTKTGGQIAKKENEGLDCSSNCIS